MASNTWSFTGTVLGFNARQGTMKGQPAVWGKMWIRVGLDPIQKADGTTVDNNVLFVHVSLNYDKQDRKHQDTLKILNTLKDGTFVSIREAKIDKIKRSRKDASGNWEDYFETGIRARPNQISVSSTRLDGFNCGLVAGQVSQQAGTTVLVEEPYMVPGKKVEWKTRDIPLVLPPSFGGSIKGRNVVATAKLAGVGPAGNNAICGYIQELLVEP